MGYPNEFETDDLTLGDSALDNSMQVAAWGWEDNRSDLGQPVDRDRWFMNQTVNATTTRRSTRLCSRHHPRPSLLRAGTDPAVNYGAIGGVIGHEWARLR